MATLDIVTDETRYPVDWAALARLIERGGLNARDVDQLRQSYRNSAFCYWGYLEGKLVATAHAISDFTYASYLSDVVVDPDLQGRGLGDQLMRRICEDLRPYGKLFIYAVPDKIDFYRRYDFHLLHTGMVTATPDRLQAMQQKGYID